MMHDRAIITMEGK